MTKFWDYMEFIYNNSLLTKEEAKEIAVFCYNRNWDKHDALELAREEAASMGRTTYNFSR